MDQLSTLDLVLLPLLLLAMPFIPLAVRQIHRNLEERRWRKWQQEMKDIEITRRSLLHP